VSWGGFVAMDAITIDPSCVDRLVLLVPAGVVNGPFWKATTQVMIPLGLYKLFPNEKRLRKLMDGLMTTWDDDWAHYLGDALRSFNMDFRPPPLTQPEQLEDFDRPTLVVAAEDDLSFPGEKLLKRMDDLIPHAETELIEGSRHMPPTTEEFRRWMANRIDQFLAATETENVSAAQ
jgi:pimeloyl-ACP methyl ester carboxylesterase